ncbi:NAR1 ribosyltransferase, partial [Cisticola juncidis]|nr:NAR1 ribosyltransferase [Cisticola juncidis]
APDSFDDRYEGCGPAMTAALPALNHSEMEQNPLFKGVWEKAVEEWKNLRLPLSPLSSPAQAIALMAYTMEDLHTDFNKAVRVAGSSPQQYRDNFHFKTLHFLLTQALATLRGAQKGQCLDVFRGVCGYLFKAKRGDTVRFGYFASTSLKKEAAECFGKDTFFEVRTCHGAFIQRFSKFPGEREVLIPPYETFEVVKV